MPPDAPAVSGGPHGVKSRALNSPGPDGTNGSLIYTATTVTTGRWYHVVGVYDAPNRKMDIYLDGKRDNGVAAGVAVPASLYSSTANVLIGRIFDYGDSWNGKIDEARIYNRALTAAEVKQLYNLGSVTQGHSNTVSISNGLVGYWPLDGATTNWRTNTTADLSGNGNAGQMIDMSTSTSPTIGKIGQALKFNGTSQYINNTAFSWPTINKAITIAFWTKTPGCTSSSLCSAFTIGNDTNNRIQAHVPWNDNVLYWDYGGGGVGSGRHIADFTPYLNKWTHVVLTSDGVSQSQIYFNGNLVTNDSTANSPSVGLTGIYIGTFPACCGQSLHNGPIDDFRVYNRVLTQGEVQQLYHLGTAYIAQSNTVALSNGLVGYWPFDGSSIDWRKNQVADMSGNGNTGTLVNLGTTTAPVAGKIGQALRCTGANSSEIDLPDISGAVNTGSYSLWVKPSMVVASFGWIDSNFDIFQQSGLVYFRTGTQSSANIASWAPDTWHYAAMTWNGTNYYGYLDGALVTSGSQSGYRGGAISLCKADGSYFYTGTIDDVRVYNRALSATEVKQLYHMGR